MEQPDNQAREADPGVYVISLTPFDEDERLDESSLRLHLQRMAAAGIGVYVGGGGSGEAYSLTPDECRRVLEIAVDELKGRVPVRAMGVEPRTALDMIRYGELCVESGVDAMQVYPVDFGHGGRPTIDEIRRYLDDVLVATSLPVVLATHLSVGYQIPVTVLVEMRDRYPHVVGINCTNSDFNFITQLCSALGERTEVYTGLMTQALPALAVGAAGYLSTEANIVPRLCRRVIERYRDNDLAGTIDAYSRLLRFSGAILGEGGGIRSTKALLGLAGLPAGRVRRPRLPIADEEALERLAVVILEFGIGADS